MELQKAIQNELAARRNHIANSFTNSKEILNEGADLTKAEGEETPEGEGEKEESDDDSEAHGESGETEKAEENVFEVEAESLIKAEEDEANPFIQEAEAIEKGEIYDAVNYSGNIKLKKTGKELKEQINTVVLPALNAEIATKEAEADTLLEDCGAAPKGEVSSWYKREIGIETPFKEYPWEETRISNGNEVTSATLSFEHAEGKASKLNLPATEDEANARRQYNEKVREICNLLADIKTCEIIAKLSDTESFELTPKQITAFKF